MTQQEYEEMFKENAPSEAATPEQGQNKNEIPSIHDNTSELIEAIQWLAYEAILNPRSEKIMWRLRSIIEVLQGEDKSI